MPVDQPRLLHLRAGDVVRVRSKQAILATLDVNGRLDELPFMPEMLACCGKQFRVSARAHKTCDTVNKTGGRRMDATVHLEGVRCDGAAHGGCQAACLLFWKEAWLERLDSQAAPDPTDTSGEPNALERVLDRGTRASSDDECTEPRYVCQATQLPLASRLLPWWDVRQYVEDYTSGNVTVWQLVAGATYVCYDGVVQWVAARRWWRLCNLLLRVYDRFQALTGGVPYPRRWGTIPIGEKTPSRPLNLHAGELVEVRSYADILATLDGRNRNRGMFFDAEEVPHCGKRFRVRAKVTKIIDERTGRMLVLKDHNVILEGAVCQAWYSDRRMHCPRAIFPIWRETWLKRADEETS